MDITAVFENIYKVLIVHGVVNISSPTKACDIRDIFFYENVKKIRQYQNLYPLSF